MNNKNNNTNFFVDEERLCSSYYKDWISIPLSEISFIKSYGNYCKIILKNKISPPAVLIRACIKNLISVLCEYGFLDVHRSYIINISSIDKIYTSGLYINGIKIPVNKARMNSILERLIII